MILLHGADRQVKLHGNLHIAHMLIPAHHEDRPALWRKGFDIGLENGVGLCVIEPIFRCRILQARLLLRPKGDIACLAGAEIVDGLVS